MASILFITSQTSVAMCHGSGRATVTINMSTHASRGQEGDLPLTGIAKGATAVRLGIPVAPKFSTTTLSSKML